MRTAREQKIAYMVDAAYREENVGRIIALVRGADQLFIDSMTVIGGFTACPILLSPKRAARATSLRLTAPCFDVNQSDQAATIQLQDRIHNGPLLW